MIIYWGLFVRPGLILSGEIKRWDRIIAAVGCSEDIQVWTRVDTYYSRIISLVAFILCGRG